MLLFLTNYFKIKLQVKQILIKTCVPRRWYLCYNISCKWLNTCPAESGQRLWYTDHETETRGQGEWFHTLKNYCKRQYVYTSVIRSTKLIKTPITEDIFNYCITKCIFGAVLRSIQFGFTIDLQLTRIYINQYIFVHIPIEYLFCSSQKY